MTIGKETTADAKPCAWREAVRGAGDALIRLATRDSRLHQHAVPVLKGMLRHLSTDNMECAISGKQLGPACELSVHNARSGMLSLESHHYLARTMVFMTDHGYAQTFYRFNFGLVGFAKLYDEMGGDEEWAKLTAGWNLKLSDSARATLGLNGSAPVEVAGAVSAEANPATSSSVLPAMRHDFVTACLAVVECIATQLYGRPAPDVASGGADAPNLGEIDHG